MEKAQPNRRRWYRFSLRMMLVVVTLACIVCWYWSWASKWITQRQQYREHYQSSGIILPEIPGPWQLRIVGERGVEKFLFVSVTEVWASSLSRLFPESEIHFFVLEKEGKRYFRKVNHKNTGPFESTSYYQNGVLFQEEFLYLYDENEAD